VEPRATSDGECALSGAVTVVTDTSTRSGLGWALVVVLALILGSSALVLARRGANRSRNPAAAETLPIPRQALLVPGEHFATDSFVAGGSDLWTFTRAGSGLRVQRLVVTASAISPQPASLITSPPAGILNVAVVSWRGGSQRALVLTAQQGHLIVVQVRRAVPPFVILAQARTQALPLGADDVRSVFVGGNIRGSAELIVVDRPATAAGVMRIRVLTRETGFHSVIRDVQLGATNSYPVSAWNLVAGGVNSMAGDLLFISRKESTASGKIEVHALLSSAGYRAYGTQVSIDSPEGAGVDWSYALAHSPGGAPVLYGIDLARRWLMRFSL
jgi:hypothetical protein